MRNLLHITRKDLKLRLRDKSFFIIGILAPLVLAFIFNTVFGSAFDGESFAPELGIVETDSQESAAVLEQITTRIGGEVTSFPDRTAAETAIDDGEVGAVFLVPDDFDQLRDTGQIGDIEVLGGVNSGLTTQIASGIANGYLRQIEKTQLSIATALALGGDPAMIVPAALADPGESLVSVGEVAAEVRQLDLNTQTVAGMSVFFLLFTAQAGLLSLLEERRDGTLARMLSTPTTPGAILGAKSLVSVILGLVSLCVLIAAGIVLMDARWGDPFGVALLVIAGVLAAVGISAVTTGLAKTPEQAGNIQGIVATVLGLLGGAFFPIGQDGGLLARLTALTPHFWFTRGLSDLAGDQPTAAALPAVGWLLVIALVTGVAASLLIRRKVAP